MNRWLGTTAAALGIGTIWPQIIFAYVAFWVLWLIFGKALHKR